MSKKDLAEEMARSIFLKKYQAYDFIDLLIQVIIEQLRSGEKVMISGFGTFGIRIRKAKKVCNPSTGETIMIPACKTIRFTPSLCLRRDMEVDV